MIRLRPRMVAATLVLSAILLAPTSAQAFPGEVASGETHASITTRAFTTVSDQAFPAALGYLSPTMQTALAQMIAANKAVDCIIPPCRVDQKSAASHFDGDKFVEGQNRVVTLRAQVISDLDRSDVVAARRDLGGALHTIQDFYAHSNWVENGRTAPSASLGRPGYALLPVASGTVCSYSTLVGQGTNPNYLTSGYYRGEDDAKYVTGRCRHGGSTDWGIGGINKDTPLQAFSPHYSLHSDAAKVADLATQQFLNDIRLAVDTRKFASLMGASDFV